MNQGNQKKDNLFAHLGQDFPSSVVVALVAVPLCLGIALASGAPLFSGVIAGIVGGIVVGIASGSALGVSGPAAGLAVIVLMAIQELEAFNIFLMAVVLAGVFQMLFGFLKAGIVAYYFPSNVIKGMLAGIGVLIFLKQIPHAFGYDKDYEGSVTFQQPDGHNTLSELYYMFEAVNMGAIIITAISLIILILWEQPFMKKPVFRILSGPLVVVILGIVMGSMFAGMEGYALTPEQLVQIPVLNGLGDFASLVTFPDFTAVTNPIVWKTGFVIALVASIETLLCAEATDKLDPKKRVTPMNRELKASGLGNLVSGLIGGLPVTQVIIRSSVNIQSGGQTKMAAILHGFILLIFALAIPAFLNMIPLASLAAILIMVGYKLAKPTLFKQIYTKGWSQFLPFLITIIGIVITDLLTGIAMGMVVSIFYILYNNYKKPYFFYADKHEEDEPIVLELSENVSFLNKASILQTLNHIPENSKVIIDAHKNISIHPDVVEIIEDFRENAKYKNIELEFINRDVSNTDNPFISLQQVVKNRGSRMED